MSVQLLEQPNLSAKTNVIDEQRLTLVSTINLLKKCL